MRQFFRRLWCALRDHPYPVTWNREAHQAWLDGEEPFAPLIYCSHCDAEIKQRRGGMHS